MVEDSDHTTGLKAEGAGKIFKLERNDLLAFLRRNPGLFLAFGDCKYII